MNDSHQHLQQQHHYNNNNSSTVLHVGIGRSDSTSARRRPGQQLASASPSNSSTATLFPRQRSATLRRTTDVHRSASSTFWGILNSRCGCGSFQNLPSGKKTSAIAVLMIVSGAVIVLLLRYRRAYISTTALFRSTTTITGAATAASKKEASFLRSENRNSTTVDKLVVVHSANATREIPSFHHHAIPDILIFTHSINLLETVFDFANTPRYELTVEQKELLALQENVRNITKYHPASAVRFLTDTDCIKSIRAVYNKDNDDGNTTPDKEVAEELIRYFKAEKQGMFKADLCRGTALYESGGLYFDVDLGVRMNLWQVLRETTEFATIRVHHQSMYPGAFFQAFTAATQRHPVILRYVQLFLQHYRGAKLGNSSSVVKGPLGVLLLKRAFDEIQAEQQEQFVPGDYDDPASTRTHLNATTELWQEVLYAPELQKSLLSHVPPPKWGSRRACKFVVVSSLRKPLTVPFYSRIAGSRICPTEEDMKLQRRRQ